jgi:hypothetical protein
MLPPVLADRERGMRQGPSPWAAVARLGQAYWLFGNLYEAVVDVPQLLADAHSQRPPRLLGPGSPVRYYAPIAPLTLAATAATLTDHWRGGGSKAMIAATAVATGSAVAMTGYLVRTVNLPLLHGDLPVSAHERRRLIRIWHQTNAARLVALAGASWAMRRTARANSGTATRAAPN